MEELLQMVEWVPTLVSFVFAFGLGWVWYSPILFQKGWLAGIGVSFDDNSPMLSAMVVQALGTLLFALIINIASTAGDLMYAILVGVTLEIIVKANGLFSQKYKYAIVVESGYILAMTALIVGVNLVL